MEVGVRELRQHLSRWLAEVKKGKEIVVTERGKPVAKLVGTGPTTLERLIAEGRVTPAKRPKGPIKEPGVEVEGSVVDLMLEQKRERPY